MIGKETMSNEKTTHPNNVYRPKAKER